MPGFHQAGTAAAWVGSLICHSANPLLALKIRIRSVEAACPVGLMDFFYQRDGEIIAFVRSDLAVAGTGLSSAAPVVDIQVMNAA
jgi:hypothetical protein